MPGTDGIVTALALQRARRHAGLSRADLAERLDLSGDTVKGWETGKRPLTRASVATAQRVRRELRAVGVDAAHLAAVDEAARADDLLAGILTPAPTHVLAREVLTRPTVDLLLWPVTGRPPRSLGGDPERPVLAAGQRAEVHAALRAAAERAAGPTAPMLRRQAGYLLATDPTSSAYLRDLQAAETRRLRDLTRWTPQWLAARSLGIALAMRGDRDPLLRFVDRGLADDQTLAANLAYYAAWVGDDARPHTSDAFMAAPDLQVWRGEALLASLTDSLNPASSYLEVTVRTLWSLLDLRPWLLDTPGGDGVGQRAQALLDEPGIGAGARRELEHVTWMARARRS